MRRWVHVNPAPGQPLGTTVEGNGGVVYSIWQEILCVEGGSPVNRAVVGKRVSSDQLQGEVHEFEDDVKALAWIIQDMERHPPVKAPVKTGSTVH